MMSPRTPFCGSGLQIPALEIAIFFLHVSPEFMSPETSLLPMASLSRFLALA
jgi:hypothetical protein